MPEVYTSAALFIKMIRNGVRKVLCLSKLLKRTFEKCSVHQNWNKKTVRKVHLLTIASSPLCLDLLTLASLTPSPPPSLIH